MLWTVILGSVEWNDLAKESRADVDRGVLEVQVRVAMLRSGRRNCFVGICITGRERGCGDVERNADCSPFVLYSTGRGKKRLKIRYGNLVDSWAPKNVAPFRSLHYQLGLWPVRFAAKSSVLREKSQ